MYAIDTRRLVLVALLFSPVSGLCEEAEDPWYAHPMAGELGMIEGVHTGFTPAQKAVAGALYRRALPRDREAGLYDPRTGQATADGRWMAEVATPFVESVSPTLPVDSWPVQAYLEGLRNGSHFWPNQTDHDNYAAFQRVRDRAVEVLVTRAGQVQLVDPASLRTPADLDRAYEDLRVLNGGLALMDRLGSAVPPNPVGIPPELDAHAFATVPGIPAPTTSPEVWQEMQRLREVRYYNQAQLRNRVRSGDFPGWKPPAFRGARHLDPYVAKAAEKDAPAVPAAPPKRHSGFLDIFGF
jgi:hypothetical protein